MSTLLINENEVLSHEEELSKSLMPIYYYKQEKGRLRGVRVVFHRFIPINDSYQLPLCKSDDFDTAFNMALSRTNEKIRIKQIQL